MKSKLSVGKILFILATIVLMIEARFFYVEEPKLNYYPLYPEENGEQASKDLDMTFSAGEPGQNDERDFVYPVKKFYGLGERPMVDIARDIDRPVYYKWPEVPTRRIIYGDPFIAAEKNRKFVKLNDAHNKGEVVLELRVIANNNNNGE